jgi:hypothetical protein
LRYTRRSAAKKGYVPLSATSPGEQHTSLLAARLLIGLADRYCRAGYRDFEKNCFVEEPDTTPQSAGAPMTITPALAKHG